jgi:serine/threonine protein kinase
MLPSCLLLLVLQLVGGSIISTASDVYSFGVIMYEMLTFKMPFEDSDNQQVRAEYQDCRAVCRWVTEP